MFRQSGGGTDKNRKTKYMYEEGAEEDDLSGYAVAFVVLVLGVIPFFQVVRTFDFLFFSSLNVRTKIISTLTPLFTNSFVVLLCPTPFSSALGLLDMQSRDPRNALPTSTPR